MNFIEIIYILLVILAIIACIPQLHQLYTTKESEGFSISAWVIWLGSQIVTTAYIIVMTGDMLMAVVSLIWSVFYGAMVWLIVYYRFKPNSKKLLQAEVTVEPSLEPVVIRH